MTSETPATDHQTGGVSYLYMAAAFVIVVAGMRAAEAVLNPLLMAVFLSIISAPAYFRLLARGMSEWLSLLVVIGVLSIVLFGVVFFVTSSIAGFTSQQEYYIEKLGEKEQALKDLAESWMPQWGSEAVNGEGADEGGAAADGPTEDGAAVDGEPSGDSVSLQSPAETAPPDSEPSNVAATDSTDASDNEDPAPQESEIPVDTGLPEEAPASSAEGSEEVGEPADPVNAGSAEGSSPSGTAPATDVIRLQRPSGSTMWRVSEQPMPDTEQSWTDEVFGQFEPSTLIRLATTVVQSLGLLLSKTMLVLLMVVFILLEAPRFTRKINEAFVRTEEATERAAQIVKSVQHYIVIKTWISLITGVVIAVWLHFIGISHAPLWGLIAFLFNYIPNVGSFIAAIPAVLIGWLELGGLPAFACVFGYVAVNGILGNFVEPRMMGKSLGISPLVVFCCMLFWGWVLGPVGMLLSVPLTMTARIAMDGFEDTRWLATLMGNTE